MVYTAHGRADGPCPWHAGMHVVACMHACIVLCFPVRRRHAGDDAGWCRAPRRPQDAGAVLRRGPRRPDRQACVPRRQPAAPAPAHTTPQPAGAVLLRAAPTLDSRLPRPGPAVDRGMDRGIGWRRDIVARVMRAPPRRASSASSFKAFISSVLAGGAGPTFGARTTTLAPQTDRPAGAVARPDTQSMLDVRTISCLAQPLIADHVPTSAIAHIALPGLSWSLLRANHLVSSHDSVDPPRRRVQEAPPHVACAPRQASLPPHAQAQAAR